MSLGRQLTILIVVLFLLLFTSNFFISVYSTRAYLQEQLKSHAQDTATSLGLSLTSQAAARNPTTMERMVDAVFDRGYYRKIVVRDTKGEAVIERTLSVEIEGVPSWFIEWVPLETPEVESLLMDGWSQAGTIVVAGHPGYAYQDLWRVASQSFWWLLGLAVALLILAEAGLRALLRPLHRAESQANAICNREFPVQERVPRTRELRSMVEAMNRMSRKVKAMFSEQAELAQRLRDEAHRDAVTGLANKSHFDGRMETLLESEEEFAQGGLYLIQLTDLGGYNQRNGHEAGDRLLQAAAAAMEHACRVHPRALLGRRGGGDFSLLVPDVDASEAEELAGTLVEALRRLHADGVADFTDVAHIGVALFPVAGRSPSELLSAADMALREAQAKGPNTWIVYARAQVPAREIHGAGHWRELIERRLEEKALVLHAQPLVACTQARGLVAREVLVRMPGEHGELLTGGAFLPMAERMGLASRVDRAVLEQVFERLAGHAEAGRWIVNLSPASLDDQSFLAWLYQQLEARPDAARRLTVEIAEYVVARGVESLRGVVERLNGAGCGVSLDHFGLGFTPFGYLSSVKLESIKVDGSYVRGISRNRDNRFFIQSLADIAHGLDIRLVAEGVETEEDWRTLMELHVDTAQGYHLGRPDEW